MWVVGTELIILIDINKLYNIYNNAFERKIVKLHLYVYIFEYINQEYYIY